jgi:hypothetical protein
MVRDRLRWAVMGPIVSSPENVTPKENRIPSE